MNFLDKPGREILIPKRRRRDREERTWNFINVINDLEVLECIVAPFTSKRTRYAPTAGANGAVKDYQESGLVNPEKKFKFMSFEGRVYMVRLK